MKQKVLVMIVVLAIVTAVFSTAAAPRGLAFHSIRQVPGKGYVALFDPQGKWRQDELWGFVSLPHNRQIDMDCNFKDDGKISCVIAGGISQYAGRLVKLVVYGYPFQVVIPPTNDLSLAFVSIDHVPGKGYVALFHPSGRWSTDMLWGFVVLPHNGQINMDCNFKDDGKISCVIADGIGEFTGRTLTLVVYGYPFSVEIPPRTP